MNPVLAAAKLSGPELASDRPRAAASSSDAWNLLLAILCSLC